MTECPYPKGDSRRILLLLTTLADALDVGMSAFQLEMATGINRGQIPAMIDKANQQWHTVVQKKGANFVIRSWGPALKATGVKKVLDL